MRQYELMVILDPELDDRTVAPSLDKFLTVVTKDKGTVDNIDIWGRRRLAFEITKKSEGIYAVVNFTARAGHGQGAGPPARSSTSRSCAPSSCAPAPEPPPDLTLNTVRTLNH